MGYNVNLLKVRPILPKRAAAGVAIYCLVVPATDQRATIPAIRLHTGAGGGNLYVLQTETTFRFSLAAKGAVLTIPGIRAGITGQFVVIRYSGGESLLGLVTAQNGNAITLDTPVEAAQTAMLYLMGSLFDDETSIFQLTVSGRTSLESDCPGVVAGKELGWPVMLFLENTDGNEEIEGGTIAFIGV